MTFRTCPMTPKIPYPYGRSNFQILFFRNSDSRFRFLSKKCLHELFFFFKYSNGNIVKNAKNQQKMGYVELTLFLDASSHLYKRVCPSVSPSVHWAVRQSVHNPFFFVWIIATLSNSGQLWDNSWTHLLVNSWPC